MLKSITLAFTLILSTCLVYGQQSTKPVGLPGYAVSAKGDTIFGEVNYMKKSGYRQSMPVKLADETTKTCSPRNYKYIKAGDEVFEAFAVQDGEVNENQFFWKKTSGKIDYYEYQYEIFVANNNVTKSEFYIKKKGSNDLIKLNGANFKKKVAELVADDSKTVERISAKETKLEDLEEILKEYNKGA